MADTRSDLEEYIDNLSESDKVSLWNTYCQNSGYDDDEIIDMYSFDEYCEGMSPTDIALRIFYGDFNPRHSYWRYNGYANFESFDYIDAENSPFDFGTLIDHIIDEDDDLDDSDIRSILDGGEDADEEDYEYEEDKEE